jgi:TonB family protein
MRNNIFILAALGGFLAVPAAAQTVFETGNDNSELRAVPVAQPSPAFPGGSRTGQEGRVRVDFVVTPVGRVADPVILDSLGGEPFERAARDVLDDWRFEAPGDGREIGNNIVEMRFEVRRGRDLATSNFLRRYRRIVTHLHNEETAEARARLDETIELGGWNLYEETMLSLMAGRVADQEGNSFGKLEHYRRALAVDDHSALTGKDRRALLSRIFEVEYDSGQYNAALATAEKLKAEPGSKTALDAIGPALETIEKALAGEGELVARASLANTCNCDTGVPLWHYRPARREFRFAQGDGGLKAFEARCDQERLKAKIEPGTRYALPEGARNCRVLVFGNAGTTFDFVQLP